MVNYFFWIVIWVFAGNFVLPVKVVWFGPVRLTYEVEVWVHVFVLELNVPLLFSQVVLKSPSQ